MPCLVLHGASNIGKTQIVRKFVRDHPPAFDEVRGVEHHQVISMQMPSLLDQKRFYGALLFQIGAPHNPKSGAARGSLLERAPVAGQFYPARTLHSAQSAAGCQIGQEQAQTRTRAPVSWVTSSGQVRVT